MKFTTEKEAKLLTNLSYLGMINSSSKMIKNKKVSGNYTYAIYLAPASQSGYNVCSHSTKECRLGCLSTSGRAGMELLGGIERTKNARIKKAKLFIEEQEFFMNWIVAEMTRFQKKAIKDGFDFSARLNTTSDIDWANVRLNGLNIFEIFPNVQFYDYTKNYQKMVDNKYSNYQLTFSYTGRNENNSIDLLVKGNNVAVVFDVKRGRELPQMYKGFEVVDGDLTDFRPNDGKGVIIGLRWKRIANKEVEKNVLNSPFVVKVEI